MWLRASPREGHQPLHGRPAGAGKSLVLARLASDAVTSLASIAPYATVNWGLPSALQMPMGDAGRKCLGVGLALSSSPDACGEVPQRSWISRRISHNGKHYHLKNAKL